MDLDAAYLVRPGTASRRDAPEAPGIIPTPSEQHPNRWVHWEDMAARQPTVAGEVAAVYCISWNPGGTVMIQILGPVRS